MNEKRDIVLVISDQHNGQYTSFNQDIENITPSLLEIGQKGTVYTNAYCNSPLCVPSRMSFLKGKLPSETKIFENESTLNADEVTIAHKLGLLGYETVLVGRMHFKGLEQFHGFDKRYVGDITNQYWGQTREEIKEFHRSFGSTYCQEIIGYGESPVMDFDRQVFDTALKVLNEERDKPLFMVVGFYSPHFPYLSSKYNEGYESNVKLEQMNLETLLEYKKFAQDTTLEKVENINRIYKDMINRIDKYIGGIYSDFKKKNEKGLFIYTSDHGDQLGKRKIFGKRTLYQDSINIPLVVDGYGSEKVNKNVTDLLGVHEMILNYANGNNQTINPKENVVKVQTIFEEEGNLVWNEAVLYKDYKLININGNKYLYNVSNDFDEQIDIKYKEQDIFEFLESKLSTDEVIKKCFEAFEYRKKENKVLISHGKEKGISYDSDFTIKNLFELKKVYEYTRK